MHVPKDGIVDAGELNEILLRGNAGRKVNIAAGLANRPPGRATLHDYGLGARSLARRNSASSATSGFSPFWRRWRSMPRGTPK
jgi:hypothetical protein